MSKKSEALKAVQELNDYLENARDPKNCGDLGGYANTAGRGLSIAMTAYLGYKTKTLAPIAAVTQGAGGEAIKAVIEDTIKPIIENGNKDSGDATEIIACTIKQAFSTEDANNKIEEKVDMSKLTKNIQATVNLEEIILPRLGK